MGGHRKYAASSAARWSKCTASHALEAGIPYRPSRYADEGTRAHDIAAHMLAQLTTPVLIDHVSNAPFTADPETLESLAPYIDHVSKALQNGAFDCRVEYSADIVPGKLGGTADCVYQRRDTLHVIDLKYGKGVLVDPTENVQLACYALACLPVYPTAKQCCLTIIQPRARGEIVKQWRCSIKRLREIKASLIGAIKKIESGNTTFERGSHCQFCKAQFGCPAYLELIEAPKLQDSSHVLEHLDEIRALCKAVEKEAFEKLKNGEPVPGWKLVQTAGKTTWRTTAFDDLAHVPDLYETKLIGITAAKKVIDGELLAQYTDRKAGIALTRETDERPPIVDRSQFDDIDDSEGLN
jgi:hypothetical protein